MAVPKETIWELDPHGRAKHEILRRYLGAWFPILNSYRDRILYVDGFCGPGRYKGGEPGSPIIALEVAKNHRRTLKGELLFWFIDERADRIEHLKSELSTMQLPSHFKVHPEIGRFDEKFIPVLSQLKAKRKQLAPTFAFIDPFGFSGIPFGLISQFLKQPSCEAFITFMVDAINRWLEHPNPEIGQHIVEVFGTQEALTIANGPGDRVANLRVLYQKQLQTVAKFVRYFEMRDIHDRIQYYLFFASN
ncbi:MAG TPA: three-Cys-motif partner protein TcmP, partial [Nitrospiria bacterium]|nr:three-Cys-motif partner protein TcmP [Nitrospiria bacterium]